MTPADEIAKVSSGGDMGALLRSERAVGSCAVPEAPSLLQPILKTVLVGTAALVLPGSAAGYAATVSPFGSSSLVVDMRPTISRTLVVDAALHGQVHSVVALSTAEQVRELLAALSLNKSQLASVLGISRPTLYEWLDGNEPAQANASRIDSLLRVLAAAGVASRSPLNARFVRRPIVPGMPSLLEVLQRESPNQAEIVKLINAAQAHSGAAQTRRTEREDRLRGLGFDDPSDDERAGKNS